MYRYSVDNTYNQSTRDLAGDAEEGRFSCIHHVESYSAQPTQGTYRYHEGKTEDYGDMKRYYELATQWGAAAVEEGRAAVARGVKEDCGFSSVGRPGGSAGGVFPYDYNLRGSSFVQLIVGKRDKRDARELLESFDLVICKCSFDGRNFRVPAPVGHAVQLVEFS